MSTKQTDDLKRVIGFLLGENDLSGDWRQQLRKAAQKHWEREERIKALLDPVDGLHPHQRLAKIRKIIGGRALPIDPEIDAAVDKAVNRAQGKQHTISHVFPAKPT